MGVGSVTALAYFLTRGTATTSVTAPISGAPPPVAFTLSTSTAAPGPLTPGGAEVEYNIAGTNPSSTPIVFSMVATVKTDGTGIFDTLSHAYVDGCLASWFTAVIGEPGGFTYSLAGSASGVGLDHVTISMSNPNTDQSACEGLSPEVDIAAS